MPWPAIVAAIAAAVTAAAATAGAATAGVQGAKKQKLEEAELFQKQEQHRADQENQIRNLKIGQIQNDTDVQQKYINQIIGVNQDSQKKRQEDLASLGETISKSFL